MNYPNVCNSQDTCNSYECSGRDEFNYCQIRCCDYTRSADDIFGRFFTEQDRITSLLLKDPGMLAKTMWSTQCPLSTDRSCWWRMGNSNWLPNTQRGIRRYHACPQCRNIDRLVDLRHHPIGTPFLVEYGSHVGKSLILNEFPLTELTLKKGHPTPMMADLAYRRWGLSTSPTSLSHLEGDSFTSGVLLQWAIEHLLKSTGMPHYCHLYTAFVCGDSGYMLKDHPSIGNIQQLKRFPDLTQDNQALTPKVVRGILIQLIAVLKHLEQYDFIHGAPTNSAIVFSKEPCSYMYNDVHVASPVTLKLDQLDKSSLTLNSQIRIHSKPNLVDRFANQMTALPSQNGEFYCLNNTTAEIYLHLQRLGLPLCSSLDGYCFILSLMSEPSFGRTVLETPELNDLWKSMWTPDREPQITKEILEFHQQDYDDTMPFSDIVNLLKSSSLRKNLIPHLWNQFNK